ncbi:ABC transporter substrate-binding protein [Halomonas aquamarina]|uniref:ABC transporter substrate-binding protein n=1 Tax=Vreelandella aquamarina TaxID=77097 RepID=A0ACC5VRQ5_9GAMM|nr:ABC transporter substrate-binding protein [Halomonas aquamarina]MBZ5486818.1 ABC transporter substrate-binding protein [Halomonas aquamarina]
MRSLSRLAIAISLASSPMAWAEHSSAIDDLLEAARQEPAITVYDSTGKIIEQAEAFSKKYGLKAEGVKSKAPHTLERIIREAQAGNIQTDVAILADAPAAAAQLLDTGFAYNWFPDELVDTISERYRDPLAIVMAPNVWTYNTALHDTCPIGNIWELTEPEWTRRVTMQDPLGKPSYVDWFNQMAQHGDEAMAAAYEAHYGHPLANEESATSAWVKALAANAPLLTDSDSNAAEAVASPDQQDSFIGLTSTAKFRDNANGMTLGICEDLDPWLGWTYPSIGLIASGTQSPNAAKLFLYYLLTEEGIAPQAQDGKISTRSDIALPASEPSGIGALKAQLFDYSPGTAIDDWENRQDWQDLWMLNYRR